MKVDLSHKALSHPSLLVFGLQPRLNLKEISQADSAFHNSTAWGSKHCYGYCRKKIGMYGKNINGKGCNRWNYALRLFKRILLHLVYVEWNVRYIFGTLVSLKFSYFMERKIKNFLGRFSVNAWFLQPWKWNCCLLLLIVTPSVDTCTPCTL